MPRPRYLAKFVCDPSLLHFQISKFIFQLKDSENFSHLESGRFENKNLWSNLALLCFFFRYVRVNIFILRKNFSLWNTKNKLIHKSVTCIFLMVLVYAHILLNNLMICPKNHSSGPFFGWLCLPGLAPLARIGRASTFTEKLSKIFKRFWKQKQLLTL